jgi:hypothetical protein
MEAEVKPSALGGAAMAGGGMWRRKRGIASDRTAKRHGNTKSVSFSPFSLTREVGTAYTNAVKKSHAGQLGNQKQCGAHENDMRINHKRCHPLELRDL